MTGRRAPLGLKCMAALLLAILASSCDRPAPPAPPPSAAPGPSAPPPGILRLSPGPMPPEITQKPEYRHGLPSLCLRAEYAGPKLGLRIEAEAFEQGKSHSQIKSVRAIDLPLSGEVAQSAGGTSAQTQGDPLIQLR